MTKILTSCSIVHTVPYECINCREAYIRTLEAQRDALMRVKEAAERHDHRGDDQPLFCLICDELDAYADAEKLGLK